MEGRRLMGKGPSPLFTPLERFLSSPSEKKLCDTNKNGIEGYGIPRIGTIGILPRGVLLHDLPTGRYDGLFADSFYGEEGSKGAKSGSCNSSSAASANIVKGQWTAEEDSLLMKLVKQHGVRKWSQIAKKLVGRIGKQCRERWHNHLRPDIKKDTWSEEEERLLVEAHEKVGNRWAEIAKRIPGRSENSIKNHWNATKRRQNSKRKSKRKSGHGSRSHPSILQEYIRSKTLEENSIAFSKPTESESAYSSFSSATYVADNCMQAMQLVSDSFDEEGYRGYLIQEPSMIDDSFDFLEDCFFDSSQVPEYSNGQTFGNPNYGGHLDSDHLYHSCLLAGGPSASFDECNNVEDRWDQESLGFKKDMDLIEMISSSQSSCSQRSNKSFT